MRTVVSMFHGKEISVSDVNGVNDAADMLRIPYAMRLFVTVGIVVSCAGILFGYGHAIIARTQYYTADIFRRADATSDAHMASIAFVGAADEALPSPVQLPLSEDEPVPSPSPAVAPSLVASGALARKQPTPTPTPVPPAQTIGELYIEKLNVRAPILLPSLDKNAINKALERGVILWPDASPLDAGGTSVILGHSSSPISYRGKYPRVFAMLEKLEAGDILTITAPGRLYTYTVRDRITLNPKKDSEEQMFGESGEILLLVSCWPVGTNWNRIIVRADRAVQ